MAAAAAAVDNVAVAVAGAVPVPAPVPAPAPDPAIPNDPSHDMHRYSIAPPAQSTHTGSVYTSEWTQHHRVV